MDECLLSRQFKFGESCRRPESQTKSTVRNSNACRALPVLFHPCRLVRLATDDRIRSTRRNQLQRFARSFLPIAATAFYMGRSAVSRPSFHLPTNADASTPRDRWIVLTQRRESRSSGRRSRLTNRRAHTANLFRQTIIKLPHKHLMWRHLLKTNFQNRTISAQARTKQFVRAHF